MLEVVYSLFFFSEYMLSLKITGSSSIYAIMPLKRPPSILCYGRFAGFGPKNSRDPEYEFVYFGLVYSNFSL